ncbi:hypothetical protein LJR189_004696 [Acidovorax delafieldii]|jgi:hypothetical protein|uniref:hypothetical protein n=1 Tax=Acidovorax delafieldii TaxID=47920 RepID=UPI003ECD6F5B
MSASNNQKGSGSLMAALVVVLFRAIFLVAKLVIRIARLIYRVLSLLWIEYKKGFPKGVSVEASMAVAEESPGDPFLGGDERFQIASRIHTARLKRHEECVGRLWLYSYEQAGFIRQVFKINDSKLATALGTNRLDLGCVGFDPKAGEAGIETIKSEALEIVKQRFSAIA